MKCEHDNCLTCPYPDCISDKGPFQQPKKKPGRKKLDPEERRKNKKRYQQEYNHNYYKKHRQKQLNTCKQYYLDHKEEIKMKKHKLIDSDHEVHYIWMTNGTINKRILSTEYDKYKSRGWIRGRTCNHTYHKGE